MFRFAYALTLINKIFQKFWTTLIQYTVYVQYVCKEASPIWNATPYRMCINFLLKNWAENYTVNLWVWCLNMVCQGSLHWVPGVLQHPHLQLPLPCLQPGHLHRDGHQDCSAISSVAEPEPDPQGAASFGLSRSRDAMRLRIRLRRLRLRRLQLRQWYLSWLGI
jgi:hypothetical protein